MLKNSIKIGIIAPLFLLAACSNSDPTVNKTLTTQAATTQDKELFAQFTGQKIELETNTAATSEPTTSVTSQKYRTLSLNSNKTQPLSSNDEGIYYDYLLGSSFYVTNSVTTTATSTTSTLLLYEDSEKTTLLYTVTQHYSNESVDLQDSFNTYKIQNAANEVILLNEIEATSGSVSITGPTSSTTQKTMNLSIIDKLDTPQVNATLTGSETVVFSTEEYNESSVYTGTVGLEYYSQSNFNFATVSLTNLRINESKVIKFTNSQSIFDDENEVTISHSESETGKLTLRNEDTNESKTYVFQIEYSETSTDHDSNPDVYVSNIFNEGDFGGAKIGELRFMENQDEDGEPDGTVNVYLFNDELELELVEEL